MAKNGGQYDGFLLEDLREQYKTIMEWVKPMRSLLADVELIKAEIISIKEEQVLFRLVAKDISKMVNDHEKRITKLETA